MISIPRRQDYADTNVRLLGLLDQMTRTEQAERMNELQRGLAFRSMGDAKRAAQSFNNAMGRGVSRMNAEDFRVESGANAPGAPRRGLAQTMKAIDPSMDEAALSGEFTGLGKKLLAQGDTTDPRLNEAFKQSGLGQGEGFAKELATGYGPKAAKALERINKVAVNTADFEAYKERAKQRAGVGPSDIPTEAEEQYGYYFDVLNKARLSGNPGAIRDAKNDLVLKYRMLDNKFGWNMSAGLKDLLAERPSGGVGGGKKVLWKERGSERKQYLPEGQVPKDSENWVPIDSEDSSALRRDLVKLDEQIAAARAANDEKTLSTLMARRRQLEGKTPETKQNFVARMDNSLINPYLSYQSGDDLDTRNVADNTPANKNQPVAQPKIKYKEGYEYEVNGQRMVYQNGRLRKL
jgi:hypothetical protein